MFVFFSEPQSISMTTEKALVLEMRSAMEGDAKRTNQVRVFGNLKHAVNQFTQRSQSN